jgi:ParB family chromosome partitioning protein
MTSTSNATSIPSLKTYPLKSLFASEHNVRKRRRTPEDIKRMAHSIAAHGGLLQNLVVVPEVRNGRRTGRAGVTAGETRRLALCLLRDGGVPDVDGFTDDYPVPVVEVEDEEAMAASATENIQRTAMHPADQFEAFRELHEQCGSVEQVADFFGVTPLMVRQRLKLANASPKVFEVYRADGMTLEQLMALSITDDHAAQERVWASTKGRDWDRSPDRLRQALTERELDVSSPLVRFVGLDAYDQAGGRVRQDLFGEPGAGHVMDVELLQRLGLDKIEKAAEPLRREGWGWVQVRLDTFNDSYHFGRAAKGRRALGEAEQAEVDALEAAIDGADQALGALDEGDSDHEDPERRRLLKILDESRTRLRKLEAKYEAWSAEVMALAGAVVALDRSGRVEVHRGLVRPEDRKAAAKAAVPRKDRGGEGGAASAESKAGESEALTRRLTAHRTIALQRVLADNTQVALAALAHNLVQRLLVDDCRTLSALDVQAKGCQPQMAAVGESRIQECRAWLELQAIREQWGERLPGDPDRLLAWLIALPLPELCELLALCSALAVNHMVARPLRHEADALALAVQLDMAEWWEPTGPDYLAHVPKAQIAVALSEAGMPEEAATLGKMKKAEAVSRAEALLMGKRWLPSVLRRPAEESARS